MIWFLWLCLLGLIALVAGASAAAQLQLLRPNYDHYREFSSKPALAFEISKNMYPDDFFVYLRIPKSGGTSLLRFFTAYANVSYCMRDELHLDGTIQIGDKECVFLLCSSHFSKDLSVEFNKQPKVNYLVIVRDPLVQSLSHLGPLDRVRSDNCSLSSFVHGGGCIDLSDLSNLQTDRLGGGNVGMAIANLESLFWFGIFELFETSVCLLSIQLGQLNRNICDCDSPDLLRLKAEDLDSNAYASTDLIEIAARIRKDKLLYQRALVLFLKRVNRMEHVLGMQLICASRDPLDIINLKDLVSRNIDYSFPKKPPLRMFA